MLRPGLLSEILESSRSIHRSGSMSPSALIQLVAHLEDRNVRHSVETGTGASTLVFSHLSQSHTVFAVDSDESITSVLQNPLLKREVTSFVNGPTQKTLPVYSFASPLQAALLDGPHAYPFPDLEYFYLYPHIEEGGLLVIDDIHIPSIRNLFQVVSRDDMFRVLEVCGKTAFLERTDAPVFDPWGDGWWLQGFNKRQNWRYAWRDRLKSAIPMWIRPLVRRQADRLRLLTRGRG
jgi:predicted O-methyltransferase YrrM